MKQHTSIPHWCPEDAAEESDGPDSDNEDSDTGGRRIRIDPKNIDFDNLAFLYNTNDFYTDEWKEWPPV